MGKTKILNPGPGNSKATVGETPDQEIRDIIDLGSLIGISGIHLTPRNLQVVLKIKELFDKKGLDASVKDAREVVAKVYSDPRFQQFDQR